MKSLHRACALAIFWLLTASSLATERVTILVTKVEGQVSYTSKQARAKPVEAFMQLHSGDRVKLASKASLQIAWSNSGRQESWNGPSELQVGEVESKGSAGATPAEVKQLPPLLKQALNRAPTTVGEVKQLSGVLFIRQGGGENSELTKAREAYAGLRQSAAPDDLLPDLYFLNELISLKQYQEAQKLLTDMHKRQPANQTVEAMKKRMDDQMGGEGGK
ncbi:hypothetical protein [Parachitinimonas caeni]|uniref:Tetratricopeptide repeat protein n=1 Tax=Parachitinimonas caeni TaxID=3031301 RepID=A0ABT7DZM4_9NEIS|nr:hypothetical protein [Parachitinimonas caeni]MDK2125274.1 hypothetical protein [Parachitinimonas caeni]